MKKPTRPTETREAATRRLVVSPDDWPRWPRLPMKVAGNAYARDGIGILCAGHGLDVYLVSIFLPVTEDTRVIRFANVDELIAAGWVVD